MSGDITRRTVLFPNLFRRPVVAKFDQRYGSSDGGAILLKACDERLGLTQRLASCVADARQPGKVEHTIGDLVRQRLFAIERSVRRVVLHLPQTFAHRADWLRITRSVGAVPA